VIVIGSRGSKLALWQAHHIAGQLNALGHETRIEVIKTSGDKLQDVPLSQVGGKALFTKEIEEALLADTIDLAVHSMKDVPTDLPPGLTIAAIPEREDPHDALVGCTVDQLVDGLRIGTSSLRRSSQLLALNPRLSVEMLRGNVDTRLRKLEESHYDAIVLAAAGLRRLGWQDRIRELIPVEIMCPAVGQGALAIETRDDGGAAHQIARQLDHPATNTSVTCERAMLAVLGGGCTLPVGGYGYVEKGIIHMRAIVASPDGKKVVRAELSGVDPARTGASIGRNLLEKGAEAILQALA
jgi:hydroxymethylbilane synthase